MDKLKKAIILLAHHAGPAVILCAALWVVVWTLEARLERQQKKLYALTQNTIEQFTVIADGVARAKTQVVEKHTLKKEVQKLPPEVRAELAKLNAKVEALLNAQIVVPASSGSGNATHTEPLKWSFVEEGKVKLQFTIETPSIPGLRDEIAVLGGEFDYTIEPVPIGLTVTKGVYTHDGIDGIQRWYITADDARYGTPLAVKTFDVKIPNLYKRTRWWNRWWVTIPAGIVIGAAAK